MSDWPIFGELQGKRGDGTVVDQTYTDGVFTCQICGETGIPLTHSHREPVDFRPAWLPEWISEAVEQLPEER